MMTTRRGVSYSRIFLHTSNDLSDMQDQSYDYGTITVAVNPKYAQPDRASVLFDLGEQFAADVDLKSALGDLAAVRSLVAEYRARRAELTGAGR